MHQTAPTQPETDKLKQIPHNGERWLRPEIKVTSMQSPFAETNNQALWYRCSFTRNPNRTYQFAVQELPKTTNFTYYQQGFTLKTVAWTQMAFPIPMKGPGRCLFLRVDYYH